MAINTCYGASASADPVRAVAELAAQTGSTDKDGLLFFCSPDFDLAALGRELARTYRCPTVGCTSSGHFGPAGFQRSGIIGVTFSGGGLRLRTRDRVQLLRAMEAYASATQVVLRAREAMAAWRGPTKLKQYYTANDDEFTSKEVFDLARAGDECALKVVDDTGQDEAVDYAEASAFINAPPVAAAGADVATVPGGAYDAVTKVGWQAARSGACRGGGAMRKPRRSAGTSDFENEPT